MNRAPVQTTLYSLSERPPQPSDRRSGERHLTLLRVGVVVIASHRELCLIKNMSSGGMMLQLYCEAEPEQPIEVELKTGVSVAGRVSWTRDGQAGVTFAAPIDLVDILAHDGRGPRPRTPRVETDALIYVRHGASTFRLRAADISQGGVKVELAAELPVNAEVVVTLPGLPPQPGAVCWNHGGFAGLSFNQPLPLATLVGWLRQQRG
ncbi:PilZ domain-containing protein [uncultured Sphingomonas sp.]|uniref:PilZ domain-containing protein n=1 Tax=uncultured Sphingomonas sp. TaxID=158754 RepID=UPI0025FD5BC8|nr:PilZ domain-containing protein [uncultured Sphingomonas sp.]